jgi:hypothetical protein
MLFSIISCRYFSFVRISPDAGPGNVLWVPPNITVFFMVFNGFLHRPAAINPRS